MRSYHLQVAPGGVGAIPIPDHVNNRVLAADTAETETAPTGYGPLIVRFEATASFWLRSGGTAAIPSADVTDGTGSMPDPYEFAVEAGETFSLISATDGCVVACMYWSRKG